MSNTVSINIDIEKMNRFFYGDSDCGTLSKPFDADPFSKIEANSEIKETADSFIIKFIKNENYRFTINSENSQFKYAYLKFTQVTDAENYVPWDSIFVNLSTENHFVNEKFDLIINSTDFTFIVGNPEQKNNLIYSVIFSYNDNTGLLKWGSLDPLVDLKNLE